MDLEPFIRIIRGDAVLHGFTHTVAGALAIAIGSALIGRPLCGIVFRHPDVGEYPISWAVALASALIGTCSHVGLDAMMHGDMRPLWPITNENDLLGIISIGTLHMLCVVSGLLGGSFVFLRLLRNA